MDQTTWGALALVLTILAGGYTWWAFRHRGVRAGTRGVAITLLPPAAYLTGTLKMFSRILDAVVDWLTRLVFSPSVWVGFILLAIAVVLFGVSGRLGHRSGSPQGGERSRGDAPPRATATRQDAGQLGAAPTRGRGKPVIDDDMSEIEALLKKRGIS